MEVDKSHAVYLPSWESRASTRASACPLQWLPLLLTFHSPHDDNSTSSFDGAIEALGIRASPVSAMIGTGAGGMRALSGGMRALSRRLQPGSRYAISSSELRAALSDSAVSRIMLVAGTYEFADDMCTNDQGGAALCIDRNVTIEAEVAGSVVLDAKGARRVIYVSTAGRAELIGLNIMGGSADNVSFLTIEPMREHRDAWIILLSLYTGWWHQHRRLSKSN